MSQKKLKEIEYNVDYRTEDKTSVQKSKAITTSIPKEDLSKKYFHKDKNVRIPISFDKENKKASELDVGTIKVSRYTSSRINFYKILFASITIILAVLGTIILFSALNRSTSVIIDSSTYAKYNNYIAPVVMHDPHPFNSPKEAGSDMIISSCIWRNIFQNGADYYKDVDEQGLTLMQISDVKNAAIDLFGTDSVVKTTENIYGSFYSYTQGEDCFHIGPISNLGTFVPHIEEITEKNNDLSLLVSYLSREDKFFSTGEDKSETPEPIKQMIYKLKLNDTNNKYCIYAVENP